MKSSSSMTHALKVLATSVAYALVLTATAVGAEEQKLSIICFGAHPDDCEIQAGGVAAMWAAKGHRVKFVSVSNGDIGHWREAGGVLARRRKAEAEAAANVLGISSQVLDIHDGEVLPTLENRKTIVRLIREWRADLVIAPRPNDYHPDHRYTRILVQDAAYMVTVPFFCPDAPALKKNPVFAHHPDDFQKPTPFAPDVAVAIDAVIEKKLAAALCMESQFIEGGCEGSPATVPAEPAQRLKRREEVRQWWAGRDKGNADSFRKKLIEFYGEERGGKVRYAEGFELCEYGRSPSKEELKKLFPFFD
jgi:LmbE family N-acetylglucosaminyl deacetylase